MFSLVSFPPDIYNPRAASTLEALFSECVFRHLPPYLLAYICPLIDRRDVERLSSASKRTYAATSRSRYCFLNEVAHTSGHYSKWDLRTLYRGLNAIITERGDARKVARVGLYEFFTSPRGRAYLEDAPQEELDVVRDEVERWKYLWVYRPRVGLAPGGFRAAHKLTVLVGWAFGHVRKLEEAGFYREVLLSGERTGLEWIDSGDEE
jgi:hypothetical protein